MASGENGFREGSAEERTLAAYLREVAPLRVLKAEEEKILGRAIRESEQEIRRGLAAVPLTAERLVEAWYALRRAERVTATLVERESRDARASARVDRTVRRLERELATLRSGRASAAERSRAREALRRAVLRIEPSFDRLEEVLPELSARTRAIRRARARRNTARVRRLAEQAGLPVDELLATVRRMERIEARRAEAIRTFVRHNQKLAIHLSKRFRNQGVPFLDLVQEANLGLVRAAEKFDPGRGFKFSTYASWWIQQAVVRAIQKQARTVRLPSHVSERLRRVERARSELSDLSPESPSDADVATRAGLETTAVEELRRASQPLVSLDAPGPDDRAPLGERLGHPDPPELAEAVHRARLVDRLGTALAQLTSREAEIIRRRFGLGAGGPATLEDVGEELGLSRERTRQIEQSALAKMRRWALDRGLREGAGDDGSP